MRKIVLSDHFSYGRLCRFALPSVVTMMILSLYTIVDGLFVSNLAGSDAFAALNLIWPVIGITSSIGFMVGSGGAALVSKLLGEQKNRLASECFTMLVVAESICAILVAVLTIVWMEPLAIALGATPELLRSCLTYGDIMMAFIPFSFLMTSFQSFLVVAEKPSMGMVVTICSGITNMVLDYWFIAGMNMGIAGAALATGMSWIAGSLVPLAFFSNPNHNIRFVRFHWHFKFLWQACLNGSSEMVTNLSSSVVLMLYNWELMKMIGSSGVVAYGVLQYILFLFMGAFLGYNLAISPIIAYHYGAQNRKELHSLLDKSLVIIGVASALIVLCAQSSANLLALVFVSYSEPLMALTRHAIHIYSLCFLLAGFNVFYSGFFTALNNGAVSAFLSFFRTFVFQCLAIVLLPMIWGLDGVWSAACVAEVLANVLGIGALLKYRIRYGY